MEFSTKANWDFYTGASVRRPSEKADTIRRYEKVSACNLGMHKRKTDQLYRVYPPETEKRFFIGPSEVQFKIDIKGEIIYLPIKLDKIADVIKDALPLLDLKEDWDDEGASPPDLTTFKKAIDFLIIYAKHFLKVGIIESPFIDVLRDGSITLNWENDKALLLIIFKKDTEVSYFYAEDKMKKIPFKYAIENGKGIDEIMALWMSKYLI